MADGLFGGQIALGDEIGRGAMGVVYQAALGDQPVAIKVLHPHLTSDLAVVGRFVREHQALSRIDDPNVVRVIDMIIDDPRLGIVMERLDFPDLGKLISQETIDPKRALRLSAGIAAGVAAIHDAQVVHRDLKPANVIVARQSQLDDNGLESVTEIPKIADFGVSRLVGQSIVNATTTMGTPLYMSPEAASGGAPVGRPADIYSLGVILYELLTGAPPYNAEEPIAIAVAHVNSPVPIVGGIPDQLSELLQTMLAKNPDDRPDARSVQRILESLAPHISSTLKPTVLNADVIDLTDSTVLDGLRSAATVLISSAGSAVDTEFLADQTIAGRPLVEAPSAYHQPPPGGNGNGGRNDGLADTYVDNDRTGLLEAPAPQQPGPSSWDGNGSTEHGPNSRHSSVLGRTPPPGAPNQQAYGSDSGGDHDAVYRRSLRRDMSATTASSVERSWKRWMVPLALVLLIPMLWFGWTRTRGNSDNVDLDTTNAAFSFLPRVGSNGLITTRRWELSTNGAGQPVIKAEVIIANTSEDSVTATHYEAFPTVVDAEYLINTFRPQPDEVFDEPGVATFELGELLPRARFTITYEMLAPDGVESAEELQALADNQAEVEADFVDALPSQAAQEVMETDGVLTELSLSPNVLDIEVGQVTTASLLGTLSDGTEIDPAALAAAVWIIEDPEIAEVTATNAVRGLKNGETTLTVSISDIEVSIDVVVRAVDDEVAVTTTSQANTTTSSSTTSTTEDTTTTIDDGTTTSSSTSTSTSTTTPVEPPLTMSSLSAEVNEDGSFKITFTTNVCTAASYQGAGQSYATPGWPIVGANCLESHAQTFTGVGPGSYLITVTSRTAGAQEVQRTITVVVDEPDPGEDPLIMSPLSATVALDGSFRISFSTNLCTIANYQGAGQSYVTPGWPDVGPLCWQNHGQAFTPVPPGSYDIVVRTRSAGGQSALRSVSVEIP